MTQVSRPVFEDCVTIHKYMLASGPLPAAAVRAAFSLSIYTGEARIRWMNLAGWIARDRPGPGSLWKALPVNDYESSAPTPRDGLGRPPLCLDLRGALLRFLSRHPRSTTKETAAGVHCNTKSILPVLAALVRDGVLKAEVQLIRGDRPQAIWWVVEAPRA